MFPAQKHLKVRWTPQPGGEIWPRDLFLRAVNTHFHIIGIGEVLWDLLPSGRQLGGAPANFTCHVRGLGAEARLISRVGDDQLGREIIARLGAIGIWTDCITAGSRHPTGMVTVELEAGQPRYVIHENVAWDFIEASPCAMAAVGAADAVCFGTLAQRNSVARKAIRALVAHVRDTSPGALRVYDVNLRQQFFSREIVDRSLALANVVKLNDAELPVLAEMFAMHGDTRAQISSLAGRHSLRLVVLTRGAHGSVLFDAQTGEWDEHSGIRVEVEDTIGAGDAFTAATVLGVLNGWPLARINSFANEVAAFVCSHRGATPELPGRFRD